MGNTLCCSQSEMNEVIDGIIPIDTSRNKAINIGQNRDINYKSDQIKLIKSEVRKPQLKGTKK